MSNPSQTDNMGEKGSGRNQQQEAPAAEPPRKTLGSDAERRRQAGEHPDGFEQTNGGAHGRHVRNH